MRETHRGSINSTGITVLRQSELLRGRNFKDSILQLFLRQNTLRLLVGGLFSMSKEGSGGGGRGNLLRIQIKTHTIYFTGRTQASASNRSSLAQLCLETFSK